MFFLFALFLLGFDPVLLGLSDKVCTVVSAAIHFLSLSLFAWTLVEGVQLYRSLQSNQLTDTDSTKYSNLLRYVVGYGLPLGVMTVTLLLSQVLDGGDENFMMTKRDVEGVVEDDKIGYCWLKENSFIYCFAGPVAIVLIINTLIFAKAVRVANIAKKRLNTSNTVKVFGQMKTWFILCFLLGQTWAFGFLIQEGMEVISYIFVILNGSSGIFLFVHTILMNEVILLEVKIFLGFHQKEELGMEHSGGRIMASKSFVRAVRPNIKKRKPARMSTSSEELPPMPRPARKVVRRHPKVARVERQKQWSRSGFQ